LFDRKHEMFDSKPKIFDSYLVMFYHTLEMLYFQVVLFKMAHNSKKSLPKEFFP